MVEEMLAARGIRVTYETVRRWGYPGASSLGSDARRGLKDYPTVKPTAMLEDALLDLTNRGDIVVDPFLADGRLGKRDVAGAVRGRLLVVEHARIGVAVDHFDEIVVGSDRLDMDVGIGVDRAERPAWCQRLKRGRWIAELERNVEPGCEIGMEACGGAHHWARILQSKGYDVKMIAPQFVKPYVNLADVVTATMRHYAEDVAVGRDPADGPSDRKG